MDEKRKEYASYLLAKNDEFSKLVSNIEKLRPKPFEHLLVFSGYAAIVIGVCYFSGNTSFMENYDFLAFIIASVAIMTESKRTNDRIDLLLKLLESKNVL